MSHYASGRVYTLQELRNVQIGQQCHFCKADLKPFESCPHDGGVLVEGMGDTKQWVYFKCSKCGYDWALWKLLNRMARNA